MLINVLGEFCGGVRYDALSSDVVETAKVKLLDGIACALAAVGTETRDVALAYARALSNHGRATVIGAATRLSAAEAAFVNGILVHALLQDDADPESGHPCCMVVPAALAAAEDQGADGRDLLVAIVLGYEMMWRAGGSGAVLAGSSNRGIRGYVLNGSIGAAAAAGHLLGLTGSQFKDAMSCGATFASGLLEPIGVASIERSMMAGANARSGVQAAFLAKHGLRGTSTILEGFNGYFKALADVTEVPRGVTDALGKPFRIQEAATKLYPSGIANQAAITAAKKAVEEHGIRPADVAAIRIRQFPLFGNGVPAYPSVIAQGPYTEVEEALPNKPFAVAAMIKNGAFDIHILKEQLRDPTIARLAKTITSVGVEGIAPLECEMEIERHDGRIVKIHVNASGDRGFFPTLREMRGRCHEMLGRYVAPALVDGLVDVVARVDQPGQLAALSALLGRTKIGDGSRP